MSTDISRNPSRSDEALEQAISEALEAERKRLAQRLQSTLINQINLVQAQIHAYEQTADAQSRMAFSVLSTLIQQLMQSAYDLEASLNPSTLETLGLIPALESLANQYRRNTGIEVTVDLANLRERLPFHIELTLFRITQDVLEEATASEKTTHIDFRLAIQDERLRYSISANGSTDSGEQWSSFDRRITAHGGQLIIAESDAEDVLIDIEFPLPSPVDLTAREMDVIRLLADGLTNREIALKLEVRPRTVKFHLDNIYSKLGVNSRTEAAIYALRQGWVRRPPPA